MQLFSELWKIRRHRIFGLVRFLTIPKCTFLLRLPKTSEIVLIPDIER
nr:MAG TPA: hypothetical protein [Caudoviricetes sp.]